MSIHFKHDYEFKPEIQRVASMCVLKGRMAAKERAAGRETKKKEGNEPLSYIN